MEPREQRAADQQQLWDAETARGYDTPGVGMFSDAVLKPTVSRLVELAEGGSAVEFAIGTGRVAIPLAEAGVEVSGIELSHAMIARLREKVGESAIPVVHGDMTTAGAGVGHSLVILVFNTISNLLTQAGQVECFRNAARHLAPGGRFVVELWVPQVRSLPLGHEATVEVSEPGYLLVDTYDTLNQHVVSHHVRFGQGLPEGREARIARTPHRYIWPAELDLMAQLAGFELEHRWADWDRSPFGAESRSHVSVYRKVGQPVNHPAEGSLPVTSSTTEARFHWRGSFQNGEVNALHAEAFEHRVEDDDWKDRLERLSLGWVTARREHASLAGCDWLHVDFEDHLRDFYIDACGFTPTDAGLIRLR